MNRDPLREKILNIASRCPLSPTFRACVCDLLRSEWPTLVPVPGGSDTGVDGAWADSQGRGIVITTTGRNVIANVTKNLKCHIKNGRRTGQVLSRRVGSLSASMPKHRAAHCRPRFPVCPLPLYAQAIADRLYHNTQWLKTLLSLSGLATVLSTIPKGLRRHSATCHLSDVTKISLGCSAQW